MITGLTIYQKNTTDYCNVISVHQPLTFLIDVTYTGDPPIEIPVEIQSNLNNDDFAVVGNFKAIPYKDLNPTKRQFIFIADAIIRSLMPDFADFESSEGVLEWCSNATCDFMIYFASDESGEHIDMVEFTAVNASQQFGDDVILYGVAQNTDALVFYGEAGRPAYLYFFNDSEYNNISTDGEQHFIVDNEIPLIDFNILLTSN